MNFTIICITTLKYYYLFLGKIIIYKVKNVNALHAFDFDKEPHKKLKVSKTSIISVKLMQVDYVQRILVASEKHVHVIKFA